MIKGSIIQENITILNVHAPNNRAFKVCEAKTDSPERETDESTITGGVFSTPLSDTDKSSRQKISKDTDELTTTINNLDINDIYKLLHPARAENTFS